MKKLFSKSKLNNNEISKEKKQKIEKKFPLEKIISGGQIGADQGALYAAEKLKISTGGTTIFEYLTLNGKQPELGTRFKLEQLPKSSNSHMLITRSKKNVDDSDGTIAFRTYKGNGTDKTIGYCLTKVWKKVDFER